MGRKIPGRKHRGVKDPEKQRAERFASIKDKINAPPTDPDDQQIPKSLSRIMELKDKVKSGIYNKKKKLKQKVGPSETNSKFKQLPEKPIPKFEQHPGENDRQFLNRVNRICFNITKEAKFEEKYGVEIKKNEDGEVVDVVKRPKDELELLIKKVRKEQKTKGKKKKKKKTEENKLTKAQKWQLKKTEKKQKKEALKGRDFDNFTDKVQFGEIVHAPPTLVAPKKVKVADGAPRPARKELLLKSLLNKNNDNKVNSPNNKPEKISKDKSKPGVKNTVINKKGKRKDLPFALRRQLDKDQKQIIEAYKMLKSKKYQT